MNRGYEKINRDIQEHWIWEDRPFARGQAWVDLLLRVNHKAQEIPFRGEILRILRGECLTTEHRLSEIWGWSRTKVRAFLDDLKKCGMITLKKDHPATHVCVLNYDKKSVKKKAKEPQANLNKKYNIYIKKYNLEDIQYVDITDHELCRLIADFGEDVIRQKIFALDDYIAVDPRRASKYKDHNRVIRNWIRRDMEKATSDTRFNMMMPARPIGICPQCSRQNITLYDGKCIECLRSSR